MAAWHEPQTPYEPPEQVEPIPRPPKRFTASPREWKRLHQEVFRDQVCVCCGLAPFELHHAVPRSQGGDDVEANLVPLCRTHHGILEAHESGWERVAYHVRAYLYSRHSRLTYVKDKLGEDRFEKRYPMPPWVTLGGLDRYRTPDPWLRPNFECRDPEMTWIDDEVEGYQKP